MPQQMDFFFKMIGRPVSRVLSFKTIIYLKHISLHVFSHLFGRCRANLASTIRCCSKWGLQHRSVAILWVSSYLTFPPLPAKCRRYISVALSLELPPQGVTLHPALRSSDFPHAQDHSSCPQSSSLPKSYQNIKFPAIKPAYKE